MKLIYIAGALNSDAVGYLKNVNKMIRYADKVRRAGFSVFIPCLDLLTGIVFGDYEYEDYFGNNVEWLKKADGMFLVPGWENSEGTRAEMEIATSLDIPIFRKIETLKEWRE